jgi:hypothetical protein
VISIEENKITEDFCVTVSEEYSLIDDTLKTVRELIEEEAENSLSLRNATTVDLRRIENSVSDLLAQNRE